MSKHKIIRDYFFIFLGAALMGLSIAVFMIDTRVVPGGISGIAITLHFLSNGSIPVGFMLWMMNLPVFLWGIKELGWQFARRTVFGFTVSAFCIDLFHGDIPLLKFLALNSSTAIMDLQQNDFFFLILIGAILLGVGMGLVMKHRGTTGGADVISAILKKRYGFRPGNTIMAMNIIIIICATSVIYFKDLSPQRPAISLAFYALFLTFILSRIVDMLIDGFDYARSALIISDKYSEISQAIMNKLSRGATALKGRGLYLNAEKEIIMTVITQREVMLLEEVIREIDPKAFVIINTVHEVLGAGFKRRT